MTLARALWEQNYETLINYDAYIWREMLLYTEKILSLTTRLNFFNI